MRLSMQLSWGVLIIIRLVENKLTTQLTKGLTNKTIALSAALGERCVAFHST
jgi:hypothetical protein